MIRNQMDYLQTNTADLSDCGIKNVSEHYDKGYVFTRIKKGKMTQTRSVRIALPNWTSTSENRRILRKTDGLLQQIDTIPITQYSWEIHKMGADFYRTKFGAKVMSARKIKEMCTEAEKSNMTHLITYSYKDNIVGYALVYANAEVVHYAYPFYKLNTNIPNLGLGMMIRCILWAQETHRTYIYLGSAVTPESRYKLQFKALEWFNTEKEQWSNDISALKDLISGH